MIEFRTLGGLDLRDAEGRELQSIVARSKRIALLTYLAVATPRGFHRRDTLLALLWPELDQEHARSALRQALYVLRQALGDDVLRSRGGEEVGLAEGGLRCDAAEFERLLEVGRAEEALELYRGDLLAGFHLSGCAEFERWLDGARARLRNRATEAAWALAGLEENSNNRVEAAHWARQAVSFAPNDEAGLRRLVTLLDRLGDRAGAAHEYSRFARRLKEDYGLDPSPETLELVESIRSRVAASETVPAARDLPATEPSDDTETPVNVPHRTAPSHTQRHRRAAGLAAAAVLLAALGWLAVPNSTRPLPERDIERTIAVMPFENLSGDSSYEYFSRGVSEDVAIRLHDIPGTRVVQPSTLGEHAANQNLQELGELFGAGRILEGTVRRDGGAVRITARLTDSRSGELVWAETYDRTLADIFRVQADIAQQIAGALKLELVAVDPGRLPEPPTASMTAYDYYLQGRDRYNAFTDEDRAFAIQLYHKAVTLDPQYALAWAGLARSLAWYAGYGAFSQERADSALTAARQAVSLDPKLAAAYHALGFANNANGLFHEAAQAYERALELDPNNWAATNNLSWYYLAIGKLDRAVTLGLRAYALAPPAYRGGIATNLGNRFVHIDDLAEAERWMTLGTELRPDNPNAWGNFTWLYIADRTYDDARPKAEAAVATVMTADSTYKPGHTTVVMLGAAGDAALFAGDLASAEEYYREGIRLSPSANWNTNLWGRMLQVSLGFIYFKTGRSDQANELFGEAMRFLEEELAQDNDTWPTRYQMAAIHAIQGNKEDAYRWLQAAIDAGWPLYRIGLQDPLLEGLHNDERFPHMMADVKARVDSMRVLVRRQ